MRHSLKQFTVRPASWQHDQKLLKAVRFDVFVQEQQTPPEGEFDDADADAWHWLAADVQHRAIGTGRLLASGQIGRMAVIKSFRGHKLGTAIIALAIQKATDLGYRQVFLNAQTHALNFYQKVGFKAEGDIFDEVGIPHRRMVLRLPKPPAALDILSGSR